VLIGVYAVPADIVFGRMFRERRWACSRGDLVYTWLAVRLARRTGRSDGHCHALRIGNTLDHRHGAIGAGVPPSRSSARAVLTQPRQGLETWYLGHGGDRRMGVLKLISVLRGQEPWRRLIPMAGLLGSLAGIALTIDRLLSHGRFAAISDSGFSDPGAHPLRAGCQGTGSLGNAGVLFAVIVGTTLYYGAGHFGFLGMQIPAPAESRLCA